MQGQNLLNNPGLEGAYVAHDAIGSVKVAPGWSPWTAEGSASEQSNGYGRIAEFFPTSQTSDPLGGGIIYQGAESQRIMHQWGTGANGIYQQVTVPAGSRLRFSAWGYGYSCHRDNNDGCPKYSINPSYLGMQIGIDPKGGADFYADSVIFTPGTSVYDEYKEFSVEANANGTQLTVFMMYHPAYPVQLNKVFWDNANLVVVGNATSQQSSPAPATAPTTVPTAIPAAQPAPAAVPVTGPAVADALPAAQPVANTYTVQRRDTIWTVAHDVGLPVSVLINLNGPAYPGLYSNPGLLWPGWTLQLESGSLPLFGASAGTSSDAVPRVYIVQLGDQLTQIAKDLGVSAADIIALNQDRYPSLLTDPDRLVVGWELVLPAN